MLDYNRSMAPDNFVNILYVAYPCDYVLQGTLHTCTRLIRDVGGVCRGAAIGRTPDHRLCKVRLCEVLLTCEPSVLYMSCKQI